MNLNKIREVFLDKNDVYFLRVIDNYMIVNNDYQGILLLDNTLHVIHEISNFDDISIYYIYKHFNDVKIILYCPENNCFVHINLETLQNTLISIPKDLNDKIFSPFYYWNDEEIILTTYQNDFFILRDKSFKKIDENKIIDTSPELYYMVSASKKYNVSDVNSKESSFIFVDDQSQNTGIFNTKSNQTIQIAFFDKLAHEIQYTKSLFLFVEENQIVLVDLRAHKYTIKPQENFIFLHASFLSDKYSTQLVILSVHKQHKKQTQIFLYEIN